jgi:hypothetical protein
LCFTGDSAKINITDLKALSSILLSFFLLFSGMQPAVFYLVYKLNEKAITEKYCINKNNPRSCCHGKCHLDKTIAASEKESAKNPLSLTFKLKDVEFIVYEKMLPMLFVNETKIEFCSVYSDRLSSGFTHLPSRPPVVLS